MSTTSRPLLVAIVGGDGAGKTTAVHGVAPLLSAAGLRTRIVDRFDVLDDERYPAASLLVPDIALIKRCTTQMPQRARLLFLMWQVSLALEACQDDDRAEVLLADGYWIKHAASELALGGDRTWIEHVVGHFPTVDLVIYLRPALDVAWRRKAGDLLPYECGGDDTCSREAFLDHQERIREVIDGWAQDECWVIVDADWPPGALAEHLADIVLATPLRAAAALA
jgi:dTMP kinase